VLSGAGLPSGEKADGVHEVDVEKTIPVVVQKENAVSRRLRIWFFRPAAPGDDFETRRIGAIGEPDAGRGIQKDEKGDCRGESQITAIITSRVKRPRLIRDLPEGGKARSAPDVVLGEQPVGISEEEASLELGVDHLLGLDTPFAEGALGIGQRPFTFELE
jgi:hypothetical protein